jgi:glycosyltransferase involved in cell wall biosynthesis
LVPQRVRISITLSCSGEIDEDMRIAQVLPRGVHPYSGILTAVVHLSRALSRRGHEVEMWQLHDWDDRDHGELVELLDEAGVTRVHIPVGDGPWRLSRGGVRRIRDRQVDVAHLHGVFGPTNNHLASKLAVPFVISPHGGYAAGTMAYSRRRKAVFRLLFELPMLRRAAIVCALTPQEEVEVRRFGVRGPVSVIPNGVVQPGDDLDGSAFRAELGLDAETRLAVYAGRLDVWLKRLDCVVEAVASSERWHVAMVGGDFRGGAERLRTLAADLGAEARVHLPEPRRGRALEEVLAAADLFVLLSRSEGMGLALLEAMAVGTPGVVSSEVEGLLGVDAAGAGWVTEPDELPELLRRLGDVDAAAWEGRGVAARALARRYDWSAVGAAYEEVYREVLVGRPSAPA